MYEFEEQGAYVPEAYPELLYVREQVDLVSPGSLFCYETILHSSPVSSSVCSLSSVPASPPPFTAIPNSSVPSSNSVSTPTTSAKSVIAPRMVISAIAR